MDNEVFYFLVSYWKPFLLLFILIGVVFFIKRKNSINHIQNQLIENVIKSKNDPIDMDNLIKSIHLSKNLHKELCRKYHPDRFTEEDSKQKANALILEINENKSDYNILLNIKEKSKMLFDNK